MRKEITKETKELYEKIQKEIELVREGIEQIAIVDKETKALVRDARKALENIEISARCSYLTNHYETLEFIDNELWRILDHIMKGIEEALGMSGKEIVEMVNEKKSRKEKN